jgi:23S rRNA pseudouridine1911/1915/1917 synthase
MMPDQGLSVETRSWPVVEPATIRLDAFARQCLPHLSRREIKNGIREKLFRINERIGRKGDKLAAGDLLTFEGPEDWLLAAPAPQAELRVPIVYEDRAVLVLDKPAGMATHGFSGRDNGTLANFLAAQRPALLTVGKSRWEPGLLHRLDRETSGLVLAAKTQSAFEKLNLQFRRGEIRKKYLALVWGSAEAEGVVTYPIEHDPGDSRRMRALAEPSIDPKKRKSFEALTRFWRIHDIRGCSLLEIEMTTGVMHQIRVHLAAIGHPIVGDFLYGRNRRQNFALKRHFLHACRLEFFHPADGRSVQVDSPLPAELQDVLRHLRTATSAGD